jgi:hypothetical protein
MSRTRILALFGPVVLLASAAASAHGGVPPPPQPPTEVVYVADYATGRVLRVDFASNLTTVINSDASKLKKLVALLVVNGGAGRIDVIVCNQGGGGGGKLLRYADVESSAFNGTATEIASFSGDLNAVTTDPSGNLFVVSRRGQRGKWEVSKLAKEPGGYGAPQLVVGDITSGEIVDLKIARATAGKLQGGDLLVLSSENPTKVFHFKSDGSLPPDPFNPAFPSGASPQGMAYSGGSGAVNVLFSISGGAVLRRDASGGSLGNFVSGLGNGVFKIAVGFQGGENRAFITQRNGHNVYAARINADGTGTIVDSESRGLNFPQGVGIGNGNGFYVPATASITGAFDTHIGTFKKVSKAGSAEVTCRLLPPDPREFPDPDHPCTARNCADGECIDTDDDDNGEGDEDDGILDFCRRPLFLDELDPQLKHVAVPPDTRAYPIGDAEYGSQAPRKLFLCEGTTSARFQFVRITEDESAFLDWGGEEPACDEENTSRRATFYWCPIPELEPEIHEGPTCINVSTGCGSNVGDLDAYSYFLPAVRDIRPLPDIVEGTDDSNGILPGLGDTLQDFITGGLVPNAGLATALTGLHGDATTAFSRFREFGCRAYKAQALTALGAELPPSSGFPPPSPNSFRGRVLGAPSGSIDDSARNATGELLIRANAAGWVIFNIPAVLPQAECCAEGDDPPTCHL